MFFQICNEALIESIVVGECSTERNKEIAVSVVPWNMKGGMILMISDEVCLGGSEATQRPRGQGVQI